MNEPLTKEKIDEIIQLMAHSDEDGMLWGNDTELLSIIDMRQRIRDILSLSQPRELDEQITSVLLWMEQSADFNKIFEGAPASMYPSDMFVVSLGRVQNRIDNLRKRLLLLSQPSLVQTAEEGVNSPQRGVKAGELLGKTTVSSQDVSSSTDVKHTPRKRKPITCRHNITGFYCEKCTEEFFNEKGVLKKQ